MVSKLTFPLEFYLILWMFYCRGSYGHGRLVDPPARGTMWRLGFTTPPNYNDHELFCGGFARQWMENKGRCGECGDPYDLPRPRPNESGGTFGTGIVSRAYRRGEVVTITVHLTANHLGWFEFRLCENNIPKQFVKQSCLNKNVLQLADHTGTRYELKHSGHGLFRVRVKLPENVTCTNCVIQWHYTSGNNWGFCSQGADKVGCGPQEVFRGCSDVAIFEEEDDTYFKFQNLTRIIDYSQTIKVNEKSGMYEMDEEGKNENDVEWEEKKNEKESTKYDKRKKEDREYSKSSSPKENNSSENEKKEEKIVEKTKFSNGRSYTQIIRKKTRDQEAEKGDYDRLFKDRDRDRDADFRRPSDDDSEQKISNGNYVYSNSFRKSLSSEEQIKIRDYLKNLPSKELKSKDLQHLINRPRATSLERTENPEFLTKFNTLSSGKNTITKLSEVLSLLLSLTASTSSPSEANLILDKLAQSLTRAVEHKQLSVDRKGKSFPRPRITSFYASRDSLEDDDDDDDESFLDTRRLYFPTISKKRNAISSALPRHSIVIKNPSTARQVNTPKSSRRSYLTKDSIRRSWNPGRNNRNRNGQKYYSGIDRSSEEISRSSLEESLKEIVRTAASVKNVNKAIALKVPTSSLPNVNPLLSFIRSNSSLGIPSTRSKTSSEEVREPQQLLYVLLRD